jgi:hypothetical protein
VPVAGGVAAAPLTHLLKSGSLLVVAGPEKEPPPGARPFTRGDPLSGLPRPAGTREGNGGKEVAGGWVWVGEWGWGPGEHGGTGCRECCCVVRVICLGLVPPALQPPGVCPTT